MAGTGLLAPAGASVQVALTDASNNALLIRCTAALLPSAVAGYAIGCIATATDTGVIYTNTGTAASASFAAVDGSSALTLPTSLADTSTTNGSSLAIVADAVTTGNGLTMSLAGMTTGKGLTITGATANLTTASALIKLDMTAAIAGNGITVATTGVYTGTGLATLTAGAMTTGVVLQLTSTTGLTSGSLLRATTSTAGALATNGAISLRATGAYTSTANAGLLDVLASAITGTATVVNIATTSASQTDTTLLNLSSTGYTTGYTS